MNLLALLLLVAAAVCVAAGIWLIAPAAGLIAAGVELGVAGVMTLNVSDAR